MMANKYRGLELLKFCESDCGERGKAPKFSTYPTVFNRVHNGRTAFPPLWVWKTLAALTIWGLAAFIAIEVSR